MQYGVLCLLPPAAMLIFALKTKKSFEALIFGTLVAYLIMYKAAFIEPWCDLLLSEISNADNQYILLLCGLFEASFAPRGKRNTWFFQPVKPFL